MKKPCRMDAESTEMVHHRLGQHYITLLEDKIDNVAYLQVKDITESQNEKVFIFNGWTFASDPNITPFDHAIYDLQLVNCNTA